MSRRVEIHEPDELTWGLGRERWRVLVEPASQERTTALAVETAARELGIHRAICVITMVSIGPFHGRIKACMKLHISQLSAPCFDELLGAVTVMYTVNSDLLFPPGGWQLSEAGKEVFAKLVKNLAPTQDSKLYVSGLTHSTPIGPELRARGITSNDRLSQMRAENVVQFLISQGVNPNLIASKGFGDAEPIASNDTPEGQAKNRRVELSLYPL
jgi:outer membrane protein OmpA-like peptidoglycan-associated protein